MHCLFSMASARQIGGWQKQFEFGVQEGAKGGFKEQF